LTVLAVVKDHIKERDLNRADVRNLKARLMKRGVTMCGNTLRVLRLTMMHAMRLDPSIKENPCTFVVDGLAATSGTAVLTTGDAP